MSRWDGKYSSAILSLAKELARENRVFYVDYPYTLKDAVSKFSTTEIQSRRNALFRGKNIYTLHPEGFPEKFIAVTPRWVFSVNSLPPGALYDFFSGINDRIFFSALQKTIRDYNIRKFILLNSFNPFFGRKFPAGFQPELFIYQTRDDISQARYVAKHGVRLENEMVKKARFVLATSSELTKAKALLNPDTYHLPNAADVELFSAANEENFPLPIELQNARGKILLYMGNIGWARVDFQLLKKIADSFSDDTLVLVGPTDSDEQVKAGLTTMKNVIFTGGKKLTELPAYLAYADCTLIPFQCNTLTKSIYPLKINEYLAAGKPVVATNFSDDIAGFSDVAYIAESHDAFIRMIQQAIQEDSEEKKQSRIRTAQGNSWQARASDFWNLVGKYLDRK